MRRFSILPWRHPIAVPFLVASAILVGAAPPVVAQPAPAGQAVTAWHVTITPSWSDPSTARPRSRRLACSTRFTMRASDAVPSRRYP